VRKDVSVFRAVGRAHFISTVSINSPSFGKKKVFYAKG